MGWNDDIKKIMAIVPHIESLQKGLAKPEKENYDDSQIKVEIENLGATVSELYDDVLSIKRSESSARTSQELAENFERELLIVKSKLDELKQVKPYDDRDLTGRLSKLEQAKPQKYDDKWIKDEIKNIKSIPITYDDSKIKKEIEQVKLSIPKTYDDTEVKIAVSQLLKYCESQNVTINSLSKECGKINELLNVINNRDKTIKDLKLDLKRAESSARSCEELMLNMERKVNELSARLNNGN